LKRLLQKLVQRWRRCGGAAAETGAHDGTASTSERRVHTRAGMQDAATVRDAAHGHQQGALGRRGRRTAMSPNPRAVCGETSGGAGDGGVVPPHGSGRRRIGDARGAVRQRTRRRLPGGHGLGQWEVGGCQVKCVTFLHWYSLPEQPHKLMKSGFPFWNRLGPLFGDMLQPHIQHFHDRLVIRERTAPFQHLPQRIV
jgi:hypothetical protein